MKRLIAFSLCLFFLCVSFSALADNSGQIINVNQSYQIAFTDLGNQVLKPGDIVQVFFNGDNFIYMQVMESSAILSKLGASQTDPYKTNFKDLSMVAIGNRVAKATEPPPVNVQEQIIAQAPKAEPVQAISNDDEIQALKNELSDAKQEIKELMQKIEIKDSLDIQKNATNSYKDKLKTHLENMSRIINEN